MRKFDVLCNLILNETKGSLSEVEIITPDYDLSTIKNRRFMYNAKTRTLILGGTDVAYNSHTRELNHAFKNLGVNGREEDFINGWIGFGGSYRNGVIHFSPPFSVIESGGEYYIDLFYKTLQFFGQSKGITKKTKLRGAHNGVEKSFGEIYPNFVK